jgi:hypothetical protein
MMMMGSVLPADLYVQLIRIYCDSKSALFLSNTCTRLRRTLSETERTLLIMRASLQKKTFDSYTLRDFIKCVRCGELVLSQNLKHRHLCRAVELNATKAKSCLHCCVVYSRRIGYHESGNCMYRSKKGPVKTCKDCNELICGLKKHPCVIQSRYQCSVCYNPYASRHGCGICLKKIRLLQKITGYYFYLFKLVHTIAAPLDSDYLYTVFRAPELRKFIGHAYKENVTLIVHGYGNFEWIGTPLPHCGWCIRSSMLNLIPCKICGGVNYCSKQCQDDDWKFHKHICLD